MYVQYFTYDVGLYSENFYRDDGVRMKLSAIEDYAVAEDRIQMVRDDDWLSKSFAVFSAKSQKYTVDILSNRSLPLHVTYPEDT